MTVAAPQAFTTNVALSSAGATASATSQNSGNGNYAIDAIEASPPDTAGMVLGLG